MAWTPVCPTTDVVERGALCVPFRGDELLVYRGSDDQIRVHSAFCPHAGTHLGKHADLRDGVVTCPLHHLRFSLATGDCLDRKRPRLVEYRSRVRDGLVWVERESVGTTGDRYLPRRRVLNDWMFVGFAKDLGPRPTVIERMGRRVHVRRGADGVEVTSADGSHRFPSKVDPNYGAVLAYFHVDNEPPSWTLPDFEFGDEFEVYDSYLHTSNCSVEDLHGTVLDWTHLCGYHGYEKSELTAKSVEKYNIGATYETSGKKFAKFIRLGAIGNINRVLIHGLCNLDFHYRGYFTEDSYFELKLASMVYFEADKLHQIIVAAFLKEPVGAGRVLHALYGAFKRFSFEVARLDLTTETRKIYEYKRRLQNPEGVGFPYVQLQEYAKRFYPADRVHLPVCAEPATV